MLKNENMCQFCGKPVVEGEEAGYLDFPNGKQKALVHFSHVGVKEEWERQNRG